MNRPEIAGLLEYLRKSPTAFHAIDAALCELDGFTRLQEKDAWQLAPGGRYVVTRNNSSLIAFVMPAHQPESFQIVASHSDSPTFKVKTGAEMKVQDKYIRLDVERYGGAIFSSWFDRPLSIAGRVMVRTENGVATRLVNLDRDVAMIPNVAIHMNREVNNGYKFNPAVDTMPLIGSGECRGSLMAMVAQELGVEEKSIVGTDLFLYNRVPGTVWGAKNEYVSAGRLDDLECAYASLMAIKDAPKSRHVSVCCIFDNEEVGSTTKQGANSTFLQDVLRRIMLSCGLGEECYLRALAGSFMLSADNAHATHPNHPEYADAYNQVWMNEGVVIKSNANQKYTTDAVSQAVFASICQSAGVPVQYFANRSDLMGGGTLGNISGSQVSINTVDIGLPQLAMHSCYETAGTCDLDAMIRAMRSFYQTHVRVEEDGVYTLENVCAD